MMPAPIMWTAPMKQPIAMPVMSWSADAWSMRYPNSSGPLIRRRGADGVEERDAQPASPSGKTSLAVRVRRAAPADAKRR